MIGILKPKSPVTCEVDFRFDLCAQSVPVAINSCISCAHIDEDGFTHNQRQTACVPYHDVTHGTLGTPYRLPTVTAETFEFDFTAPRVVAIELWSVLQFRSVDIGPFMPLGRARISSFSILEAGTRLQVARLDFDSPPPPSAQEISLEAVELSFPATTKAATRDIALLGKALVVSIIATPRPPRIEGPQELLPAPKLAGLQVDLRQPVATEWFPRFEPFATRSLDVVIESPAVRGRVFSRFQPIPLKLAADQARREASRQRPPDDDPFSALFYVLLTEKNWDVRVKGLDALLAAYPEGKRPYPFQFQGIHFLANRSNALLADEMGLGKTIQAILALK